MSASELSLAALLAQCDVGNAEDIAKLFLEKPKIKNVKMFASFFEEKGQVHTLFWKPYVEDARHRTLEDRTDELASLKHAWRTAEASIASNLKGSADTLTSSELESPLPEEAQNTLQQHFSIKYLGVLLSQNCGLLVCQLLAGFTGSSKRRHIIVSRLIR